MSVRKRFRKTYVARGMMEWYCQIQVGEAFVKVPFTDGGLSPYGQHPAEYTTEDEVVQCIIENSDYFANGRIELQRAVPIGVSSADGGNNEPVVTSTGEKKEPKTVNVSSVAEAKDYLADNLGADVSRIKKRDDVIKAGYEHNIDFNFI